MDLGVSKCCFPRGISLSLAPVSEKRLSRLVYLPPKRRLLTYSSTLSL